MFCRGRAGDQAPRVKFAQPVCTASLDPCSTWLPTAHWTHCGVSRSARWTDQFGRVRVWRGGLRFGLSVSAPFVWRCLTSRTITPFPHPPHRTGRAVFPHPALGQDLTPSPTARYAEIPTGGSDRGSDGDTRGDKPCIRTAVSYVSCATTGAAAPPCRCRWPDRLC